MTAALRQAPNRAPCGARRRSFEAMACGVILCAVFASACSSDEELDSPPPDTCRHPLPGDACLTVMDTCPDGFAHDGDLGCEPVLPAEVCAPGHMAIPGETACHPVAPCPDDRWGAAPDEPGRQHVDGSYAGTSDGSADRPWTSLAEALAAAPAGGVVAITDGTYPADVRIDEPVRLWGRCPSAVELVGSVDPGALVVFPGGSGSEIHDLAVRGTESGLAMSGATDVLISRVWFHDNEWRGVAAQADLGPTSLSIVDSLFEANRGMGLYASGTQVSLARTVFRGQVPGRDMAGAGTGITVVSDASSGPVPVTIADVVIDDSAGTGIHLTGVDGAIERTVLRRTSGDDGLYIADHLPSGTRSTVRFDGGLIEDSRRSGLLVIASDVTLDRVWIRGANEDTRGQGIQVQGDGPRGARGSLTARRVLVGETNVGGLVSYGAAVDVAQSRFYDNRGYDDGISGGLMLADSIDGTLRGRAVFDAVEVLDSTGTGILVAGGSYEIGRTRVTRTSPQGDGLFGDGFTAIPGRHPSPTEAQLESVSIEDSARAGIAIFSSVLTLRDASLVCQAFDISTQSLDGLAGAELEDLGDNTCGCPTAEAPCRATATDLQPPERPEP